MLTAETRVQNAICDYLRLRYPKTLFHCDSGQGGYTTTAQARINSRQNRRGWPDLFIAEPNKKYHGLFIELKAEGVKIYKKDGTPRSDKHIQEQLQVMRGLAAKGYACSFACGISDAIRVIDDYMGDTDTVSDSSSPRSS